MLYSSFIYFAPNQSDRAKRSIDAENRKREKNPANKGKKIYTDLPQEHEEVRTYACIANAYAS